jgi:hypothetical protein
MKTIPLIIFLSFVSAWSLFAQQYNNTDYIKLLKKGTLIVKLPTYSTKIAAMQKLIDDPTVSESKKKRLKQLAEIAASDAKNLAENMMAAFDSAYTFSKVLYTYDRQYDNLKAGQLDGIFLNENLQYDPSIEASSSPFFVLRFGSTSKSGTYGIDAMVIMNDQLKDLQSPFPYYQRTNDLSAFIGSLIPSPEQKRIDAIRHVSKLNRKLFKYHIRVSN